MERPESWSDCLLVTIKELPLESIDHSLDMIRKNHLKLRSDGDNSRESKEKIEQLDKSLQMIEDYASILKIELNPPSQKQGQINESRKSGWAAVWNSISPLRLTNKMQEQNMLRLKQEQLSMRNLYV